ncbi:expansin module family protein [Xylogone sp. PMI_703]|nr:expansin module family protein [Xylogone sp. PMI_703]
MLAKYSVLALTAIASLASAVPSAELERRITHNGEATVNPNPTGALGSCGIDSPDSSYTVAISNYWMKNESPGPYCGRKIRLTNTGPTTDNSIGGKGNQVVVTVEDTCPGCDENHLDLSVAAWEALTNGAAYSVVGISWNFCNVDGQC